MFQNIILFLKIKIINLLIFHYTSILFSKLFENKTNKYLKNQSNCGIFLVVSLRITVFKKIKLRNLFKDSFVNLYIFIK